MNDAQLLSRLAEANAYGEETPLPETIWTKNLALREIERRMGMETRDSTPEQTTTSTTTQSAEAADQVRGRAPRKRRPAALAAAAAFAVVIVIGGGIALISAQGDEVDTASSLAVADSYFAAYNVGDADAVMALFTPDAGFVFAFQGLSERAEELTRAEWEQRLAYNLAQGTFLTPHNCTTNDEGGSSTVRCTHRTSTALIQAVDANTVPTVTVMVITEDGIAHILEEYGTPDFVDTVDPFTAWMQDQHPADVASVEFGSWSSVEEARAAGILFARYAEDWATYLEERGCGYKRSNC